MKVAIVFSSPTPDTGEYQNIWNCCPQRQEIESDKLVNIRGKDWHIYAFNGQREKYFDGGWEFESLKKEIYNLKKQYEDASIAVLVHGAEEEAEELRSHCNALENEDFICECYTSSKGKFYENYVKPFAVNSTDSVFEKFWANLPKKNPEKDDSEWLRDEVRFLKHKFCNIHIFMGSKIAKAKGRNETDLLLKFSKANIKAELERFSKIESELIERGLGSVEQVGVTISALIKKIEDMQRSDLSFEQVFSIAKDCIQKAASLHQSFLKMEEEIHA